jgi:hypothetical protein
MRGGVEPFAAGRLVPVTELEAVLPEDIPRVSPAERAAKLAERRSTFLLRFQDDLYPSA